MTPKYTVELTSTDKAALCVLLVDGRVAAMAHGSASAPLHKGERVRWFVRARRRNAAFALVANRNGTERLLEAGACEPVVTCGAHAWQGRARPATVNTPSRR